MGLTATVSWAAPFDDEEEAADRLRDLREIDQALVGDTAALLEQGDLQVTLGAAFTDEDADEFFDLTVQIDYGLTDWLEIGISVPYVFVDPKSSQEIDVDGAGDLSLSVAMTVLDMYPFLVSASLQVDLPTGSRSKDLSADAVIWQPGIVVDIEFEDFELIVDVGGEFADDIAVLTYGVTFAYFIEEVIPSIGLEGSFDGDVQELLIVPGIGFPILDDVELGIEIPIGLNRDSSNWEVVMEVTFEF